ncbi:uncharacterized protein LOC143245477 [Tachypleus tridentatus]|uniref:uncharacterized protein LOC143245477 n=1 Tax=Tachypleus tridentatus TaxID=6853 RepID=UPI003FD4D0CA
MLENFIEEVTSGGIAKELGKIYHGQRLRCFRLLKGGIGASSLYLLDDTSDGIVNKNEVLENNCLKPAINLTFEEIPGKIKRFLGSLENCNSCRMTTTTIKCEMNSDFILLTPLGINIQVSEN